jgi:hypothetical protein
VARMVPHACLPLDDGGDARQRPQIGRETMGAGAFQKPALELVELPAMESGLAAGSTGGAQRAEAAALPGAVPPAGALATGMEHPGHKSQFLAGAEQLRGFKTPLL